MSGTNPSTREPRTAWNYGSGRQFVPIRQQRAHEYVAEQIRRHIGLRLVAPGESLPSERELAAMFGVGRVTVQQALRVLESEHLVESRRGRSGGTFVIKPSDDSEVMDELAMRLLWHRARVLRTSRLSPSHRAGGFSASGAVSSQRGPATNSPGSGRHGQCIDGERLHAAGH